MRAKTRRARRARTTSEDKDQDENDKKKNKNEDVMEEDDGRTKRINGGHRNLVLVYKGSESCPRASHLVKVKPLCSLSL